MGCYRHLTRDDREEIAALRAAGHSMRAVAATVGERHLLYVACTRASDFLWVSGVDPASEFLDELENS